MNELQKVEFDLFLCFDEICKKLELNYFLLSGTALGAVRHGGFIPWDDDLDVGMYREDYRKFIECSPNLLPEGLFLQNYKSDPEFPYLFSKLRNSNTTFIEKRLYKFNINHGIYIDIFPLDGYPVDFSEQNKLALLKKKYRRLQYCGIDGPRSLKGYILALVLRILGYHKRTAKTLEKYETLISSYNVDRSNIICSHGNRYGERDYMPKDIYGEGVFATFEGISTRIPEKYDEYLTRLYDDWKTLPPINERKNIHPCLVCDTKTPYVDYINN